VYSVEFLLPRSSLRDTIKGARQSKSEAMKDQNDRSHLVLEDLVVRRELHRRERVDVLSALGEEVVPAPAKTERVSSKASDAEVERSTPT